MARDGRLTLLPTSMPRTAGIPAVLERSRSGDGGHVWVFFSERVPASSARRLGAHLLREAMTVRAEIDLVSYDRLFPAQDFLPRQGFGNLIALPLQGECRNKGTTVFLDPSTLDPYPDQWEFLASVDRLSREAALALAETLGDVPVGPDVCSYRRPTRAPGSPPPPASIRALASAMLAVDRIGLPPFLLAALKHVASLHNPDFYEKERNRFWTGNTPRLIRCYRETLDQLLLPRGVRPQAEAIATEAGSRLEIIEAYDSTEAVEYEPLATLRPDQQTAVDALVAHEQGVLVAPPGAGKTVIACALIALHRVPTLVIVDRQPLIEQWQDRLTTYLGLEKARRTDRSDAKGERCGRPGDGSKSCPPRRPRGGNGLLRTRSCRRVPPRSGRYVRARSWPNACAPMARSDGNTISTRRTSSHDDDAVWSNTAPDAGTVWESAVAARACRPSDCSR